LIELADTIEEADGYIANLSPYIAVADKIMYLEQTFGVSVVERCDEEDACDALRTEVNDYLALLNTIINRKWR